MTAPRIVVTVTIELPQELTPALIQALRDFDIAHDPEHTDRVLMGIFFDGRRMTTEEFEAALNPDPPLGGERVEIRWPVTPDQ